MACARAVGATVVPASGMAARLDGSQMSAGENPNQRNKMDHPGCEWAVAGMSRTADAGERHGASARVLRLRVSFGRVRCFVRSSM